MTSVRSALLLFKCRKNDCWKIVLGGKRKPMIAQHFPDQKITQCIKITVKIESF